MRSGEPTGEAIHCHAVRCPPPIGGVAISLMGAEAVPGQEVNNRGALADLFIAPGRPATGGVALILPTTGGVALRLGTGGVQDLGWPTPTVTKTRSTLWPRDCGAKLEPLEDAATLELLDCDLCCCACGSGDWGTPGVEAGERTSWNDGTLMVGATQCPNNAALAEPAMVGAGVAGVRMIGVATAGGGRVAGVRSGELAATGSLA